MRIIKKQVNKPYEIIEFEGKYVCEAKTAASNDIEYIERVLLNSNIMMIGDEDGHRKALPHNFYLPLPHHINFPVHDILGTAVFAKVKPLPFMEEVYDYEVDDLSDDDIELIANILSEDNQKVLSDKFKEIYKDRDYWSPIVTTW